MNRKWKLLLCILGLCALCWIAFDYFDQNADAESLPIRSTDVTNMTFSPHKGSLFLLYPDRYVKAGTEANNTYFVEIGRDGKVLDEQVIRDPDFGSIALDQKMEKPNLLYATLDQAQYANHFYTFDMHAKRFTKEVVTYFDYDVMIESVSHQGTDTWFKTLTSHKTGKQTYIEGKGFPATISNYERQAKYETAPELDPNSQKILETDRHIAYVTSLAVSDERDPGGMVFLDKVTGKATVFQGEEEPYEYTTLYSDGTNAYFADSLGHMYRIDDDGEMTTKAIPLLVNAYYNADPIRMTSEDSGYQIVSKYDPFTENEELIVVKWTFGNAFTVEEVERPYWNNNNLYRYLYYNPLLKRSYIVERDFESGQDDEVETGRLLIVDEQMNLIEAIPVNHPWGLDFVIE
ncbi:hypothetical protein [Exiguobacterium sp.]|uniref:hypothetical protein n=1 Tax=Exiguobacterium sp. TaxID=44751 RepID=UPI00263B8912|nr:hypothetical protein [Exiguobacterium sp.]MCC5892707.1 hypothetical protein [Exiguobacterium sp.]